MNKNKIQSLIELARLDKPIGIYLLLWPSLLGLLLAGINSQISVKSILIVIIGSILVRSCGCVINDISDYKLDKLVSRTAGRPLAVGNKHHRSVGFLYSSSFNFFCFIVVYQRLNYKTIHFLWIFNSFIPDYQKIYKCSSVYIGNNIWIRLFNSLFTRN